MPTQFVSQLIDACEKECDFFENGAHKEYEESVYRRVGDYWARLAENPAYSSWSGYNGRSGVKFTKQGLVDENNNQPWSAAFVSFVMHEAGAGKNFSYAPSHSVYIVKALRAAKNPSPEKKFIARRHKIYSPKLGDLIACERQPNFDPNFDTYEDYAASGKYEAHCDIVVEKTPSAVVTIGGNVSNSVTKKSWALDANGMIQNHDPNSSKAVVICIIENLL